MVGAGGGFEADIDEVEAGDDIEVCGGCGGAVTGFAAEVCAVGHAELESSVGCARHAGGRGEFELASGEIRDGDFLIEV